MKLLASLLMLTLGLTRLAHATPPVSCTESMPCDVNLCNIRYLALVFSGKILPSCIRGQRAACDNEIDRVAAGLMLSNACHMPNPYRVETLGNQDNTVKA